MSYIELKYYRSHALEVREYGDTGWAIHIYPPGEAQVRVPFTAVRTTQPSELDAVLCRARDAIDVALAEKVVRGTGLGTSSR